MSSSSLAGMHFIVSTGEPKANPETRKLIRSQVMLGKNRGKPGPAKRRRAAKLAIVADSSTGPRFVLHPAIETYYSTIPRRVGSDLSFANAAAELDPAVFGNIMKFFAVSLRALFPLAVLMDFDENDRAWMEDLFSDAAYLHIITFTARAFFDKVADPQIRTTDQEVTVHFVKGLQMLRERLLSEDEAVKVSNSSIRVVLLLTVGAYMMGEYESARYHMKGLCKMINLRGGLAAITSKKLMMEILRCDIELALHDGSEPMFFNNPALEPFMPYPDLKFLPVQQSTNMPYSQHALENYLHRMDQDLATIWSVMQRFCSLVNIIAATRQRLSGETIHNIMASVMYRLLYLKFETGSTDEAIRLSLLGLSYHVFFQWQDMKLPYPHFPSSLKKCLVHPDISNDFPPTIMLWLLLVGAISGLSEDIWLKRRLREHVNACQVRSWNEMRDVLKSYMWIDLLHDKLGKEVFVSAL